MTESQFVDWMKGFTEGVHHYTLSPKQWDFLKEKLTTVNTPHTGNTYELSPHWVTNIA